MKPFLPVMRSLLSHPSRVPGLIVLFFSLWISGLSQVSAWDACGHELVMAMAWPKLNSKAQQAVVQCAHQMVGPYGGYDPITLACWMDDIKGFHPHLEYQGLFKSWHYINWGLHDNDPMPAWVPGTDNEKQGNVVQALMRAEVVLRGGQDPYIPTRAVACALMIHLVGDIHQPLHATTAFSIGRDHRIHQDDGANRVGVLNSPPDQDKFNLHFFWDAAWRASFDSQSGKILLDSSYSDYGLHRADQVQALAQTLAQRPVPMTAEFKFGSSYVDWARESHEIGKEFVYPQAAAATSSPFYGATGLLHQVRLNAADVQQAHALAEQRLRLAAVRLAQVLNATLGAELPMPPPLSYPPGPHSPDY